MVMNIIKVNQMSVDYGNNKGVFDLSFEVSQGEIVGFLGPNGAGKTTTIRQLMGFVKPDKGYCTLFGLECKKEAHIIQSDVGYLPGEIMFMDDMEGMAFIHFIAEMKGIKNLSRAKELIEYFELNPQGKIKKMSKGMKQKIGLVCAFMDSPKLLILDEPTSGLDPLMQNKFISLIKEEKKKGTTVFMSSHMFQEVSKTCDRAIIIKDGRLVADEMISQLIDHKTHIFTISFNHTDSMEDFIQHYGAVIEKNHHKVTISVQGDLNHLFKLLSNYQVIDFESKEPTLEDYFMNFYQREEASL